MKWIRIVKRLPVYKAGSYHRRQASIWCSHLQTWLEAFFFFFISGSLVCSQVSSLTRTIIIQKPVKQPWEASVCQDYLTCQGVMDWTGSPLYPRHCVTHCHLHVELLSYATVGNDSFTYTACIYKKIVIHRFHYPEGCHRSPCNIAE